MRVTRIEIEGSAGHVAVERLTGSKKIRIDSVIRDPKPGIQTWKTWEVEARIGDDEMFQIAIALQFRSSVRYGSKSEVHDYYRELQRFQD